MEDRVKMQDRPGEFQKQYVEQMDKLKKDLEGAKQKARAISSDPVNFTALIDIVGEVTRTIETLASYVTVLEEELRKRG